MNHRVWVLGDAVVDLIPQDEMRYLKCPGGAPANVAVAVSRLEGRAAFIGRVGNDPFGRFMQSTLQAEGVDTQYLVLDEQRRTSTVVVDLADDGERSFTFMVKPSADQFFCLQDIPSFSAHEWLHTCSIALANAPSRGATLAAIEAIQLAGGFVSFDPNLREEVWRDPSEIRHVVLDVIAKADVVKFSLEELLFLTQTTSLEAGMTALAPQSHQLVIVTLGADGALYQYNSEKHHVPSSPTVVVDTTGAGDAFVGGLLATLSASGDWRKTAIIEQAIRWGNKTGALATTQKGAMTALPSKSTLLAAMNAV